MHTRAGDVIGGNSRWDCMWRMLLLPCLGSLPGVGFSTGGRAWSIGHCRSCMLQLGLWCFYVICGPFAVCHELLSTHEMIGEMETL